MEVKIQEILKLDNFNDASIIAGKKGINNKVNNISVMEGPDITNYINKKGLLFTTLFPLLDDELAMKEFIPTLKNYGLSGVAVKLGRYIEKIPDYMIKQAESLSFPIIILPASSNFSILIHTILSELLCKKTSELELRENISKNLHSLLLNGAGIKEFINYVSNLTSQDILILNGELKLIESSFNLSSKEIEGIEDFFRNTKSRKFSLRINGKKYKSKNLIIHSINAGEKIMGYLLLIEKEKNFSLKGLDIVIEQVIILLAFLLQRQQAITQQEITYLDNFVRSIIRAQYSSQSELVQKAKVFGWDFHFPNIVLLIDIENKDEKEKLNNYYTVLSSETIIDVISRVLEIPRSNLKATVFYNYIIVFVSHALVTDLFNQLYSASKEIIKRIDKYGIVKISISEEIYDMGDISKAYKEALLVQKIYKDVSEDYSLIELYKNLGIYKIFHLIDDQEPLKDFVKEKIGNVILSDEKNDTDLIQTLKIIIKNNMNMTKSAEELYIHYNSLRYRVTKLEELGINLNDGNEMTEVAVACQLLTYLSNTI